MGARPSHSSEAHLAPQVSVSLVPDHGETISGRWITFLDGFAGPGEYTNSTDSSPTIAINQALRLDVSSECSRISLVLIEDMKRRATHLEGLVFLFSTQQIHARSRVHVVNRPAGKRLQASTRMRLLRRKVGKVQFSQT